MELELGELGELEEAKERRKVPVQRVVADAVVAAAFTEVCVPPGLTRPAAATAATAFQTVMGFAQQRVGTAARAELIRRSIEQGL